jgi:molybdate transport system substrate-binding protein
VLYYLQHLFPDGQTEPREEGMHGRSIVSVFALMVGLFLSSMQSSAHAAEITLLCAAALESWMHDVIPEFERTSGYEVKPTFGIINVITERVRKGDAADLAIVSPQQWEDLSKERKLDPSVRTVIAKVGYGVFMKKGAAKPDIGSVEAFKRAFLNAGSIAFFPGARGPTGAYQVRVFEQLGISADIKPKIKYSSVAKSNQVVSAPLFELVANGDADIGVAMISEILQAPGVELVGPVPTEVQDFVMFTTAIPTNAQRPAAAKALIDFLTSPKASSILKSKGLEQG